MLIKLILVTSLCALFFAKAQTIAQTADVVVVNKVRSNANLPGSLAFLNFSTGKVINATPLSLRNLTPSRFANSLN